MKNDNINWRETSQTALTVFMVFLALLAMGIMMVNAINGEFLDAAFNLLTIASGVFCLSCHVAYKYKGDYLTIEDDLSFAKYFQEFKS